MFLSDFLDAFASELNSLASRGLLPASRLRDGRWIRYSWLHARVTAAAARAMPDPWYPALEVKWNRRFKPDLCAVDAADRTVAVIEYESVNSSDERLMGKDLGHFEREIVTLARTPKILPEWWIICSTLPDGPVTGWKWYGWNRDARYPPPHKDKASRNANPLAYYKAHLHSEFGASWNRIIQAVGNPPPCKLVWVNLAPDAIRVMNVDGVAQEPPTEFPLSLP